MEEEIYRRESGAATPLVRALAGKIDNSGSSSSLRPQVFKKMLMKTGELEGLHTLSILQ